VEFPFDIGKLSYNSVLNSELELNYFYSLIFSCNQYYAMKVFANGES
jgi:hypothetical protein